MYSYKHVFVCVSYCVFMLQFVINHYSFAYYDFTTNFQIVKKMDRNCGKVAKIDSHDRVLYFIFTFHFRHPRPFLICVHLYALLHVIFLCYLCLFSLNVFTNKCFILKFCCMGFCLAWTNCA
jgi:hypothetical protein